jgi:uncharacterized protein YndB with AHSA1/START domain
MTGEERALQMEMRIDAPPELVFAYFTDPELYRQWKGVRAELDARPGGTYRVDMGLNGWIAGEYVVVEPPNRVVFTWGWEDDPHVPPGTTHVEVTFVRDGEATVVRLRHSGFATDAARDQHVAGWQHLLSRLAVVGAGGDPGPDPLTTSS